MGTRTKISAVLLAALAVVWAPALAGDGSSVIVWSEGPGFTLLDCDTNGDLARDVSDVVYLFGFLFRGGPEPAAYPAPGENTLQNGDANADGVRDLSDGVTMIRWLFLGGPEPATSIRSAVIGGGSTTVITNVEHMAVNPPPRFNICNGDMITLSGYATRVDQTIIQDDGGMLTKLVIRWANMKGTGMLGIEYTITGGVVLVIQDLAPGMTTTNVAQERYITNDGSPNEIVNMVFHVTMNADGEITAEVSDLSFECTGN